MDLSALIFIGVLVLLAKSFFPAYFGKKGENLATKEDIEEITQKIEAMKAAVGSKLYIHQTRYQNEFTILQDLSEKLVELRDAALCLRPTIDSYDPNEPEEERKRNRLKRYHEAAMKFYKLYETRRPFYPDDIYTGVKKLDRIVWTEVVQYKHGSGKNYDQDYWEKASTNAEEISKATDKVLNSIHKRVKYWEEFSVRENNE